MNAYWVLALALIAGSIAATVVAMRPRRAVVPLRLKRRTDRRR